MISYVIASIRPEWVKKTVESIESLAIHEHEIVVCTPYPSTPHGKVRYILDDKFGGSTYGVNKAVWESRGDWVIVGTDDHVVNYDVNRFLDLINNPYVQSLEYQVINMGAPWTDCLRRNLNGYGIDIGSTPPGLIDQLWPVVTFPAVSRKTIDNKLDGHIFHPDLLHHFVDHYLGLYVSRKQQKVGILSFTNNTAWTAHVIGDHCDRQRDNIDSVRFCKLAAKFLENPEKANYTISVI